MLCCFVLCSRGLRALQAILECLYGLKLIALLVVEMKTNAYV